MTKRRPRGEGALYQQDGKWVVRFWIGSKRLQRTATTQAQALAARDKALEQAKRGVSPTGITVGDALADYLAHGSEVRGWTPSTIESYESVVRLYLRPEFARQKLSELTVPGVQRFLNRLVTEELSPRYVAHIKGVLRSAIAHAERMELVARNVAALATAPKQRKPELQVLSASEVRALLREMEGHRLSAFIAVAAYLGLRRGECIALRWEDVDLEAGTLTVRRTGNRRGKRYVEGPPKSARSRRTIVLPELLVVELRQHRASINAERLRIGPSWQDEDRVFPGEDGGPVGATTIRKALTGALERAGLPYVRIHDLRHSAATMLLADGGGSLLDAQELLGHSTMTLTANTYAHVLDAQRKATAGRINRMMRG